MWPILLSALLILLSLIFYDFATSKPVKNAPPGPWRFPIFGSYFSMLLENTKYPYKTLTSYKEKYNSPLTSIYFGNYYVIIANTYETCKEILQRPEFQARPDSYPARLRSFGQRLGVFFDDGQEWLTRKRIVFRTLRDLGLGRRHVEFEANSEHHASLLVESIREQCKYGSVSVPDVFQPFMSNALIYLLVGRTLNETEQDRIKNLSKNQIKNLRSIDPTGGLMTYTPWLNKVLPGPTGKTDFASSSDEMLQLIRELFDENVKTYQPDVTRGLMDALLHDKISNPDLTDEQILIIGADLILPTNTQAQVLLFSLMELVKHPDIQKQCQQQIDDVVGRARLPNLNDKDDLSLIEASIRETLRSQTILPLLLPHVASEDTTFMSYDIPRNTILFPNIYSVNHDETIWGDPQHFRPQRFLNYKGKFDPKKDFTLSFGKGKRVCIGETFARTNIFLALAAILQNFTVEEDTAISFDDLTNGLVLQAPDEFKLKFVTRI